MSQGTEVAPACTFILFPLVLTFWCCHLQRGTSNFHPPPLTPQQASMTAVVMQVLPCICLNKKARRKMQQCGCKQKKFWVWNGAFRCHFLPTHAISCWSMSAARLPISVRGCLQLILTVNPAGIAPLWLKYQPTYARDLPVTSQWLIITSRATDDIFVNYRLKSKMLSIRNTLKLEDRDKTLFIRVFLVSTRSDIWRTRHLMKCL